MAPFFKLLHHNQFRLFSASASTETLLEPIDSTCSVNDLLLACIERMTLRTYVQVQILTFGRTSLDYVAAAASRCNVFIFWVDFCFHNAHLAAEKGRNHTRIVLVRKSPDHGLVTFHYKLLVAALSRPQADILLDSD